MCKNNACISGSHGFISQIDFLVSNCELMFFYKLFHHNPYDW